MAEIRPPTVSSPRLHPPQRSRLVLAVVIVVATIGLDVLGVGGYRNGPVALSIALPLATGGAAFAALRRWPWAIALAAVALLAAGLLVTRAPWSTGRLEAELDGLERLDGFEELSTDRAGRSWCRPDCPTVTRTWRVPDTSPHAAVVVAAIALANAGLAPPLDELGDAIVSNHLEVRGSKTDALVTAERRAPGDLRVTVVLSSHR